MPIKGWKTHAYGTAAAFAAHKLYQAYRGRSRPHSSGVAGTFLRGRSFGQGALYAASTHRVRTRYRRRRIPYRRRRYIRKLKRFGHRVKRAIRAVTKRHRRAGHVGKNAPKWHIYRSTSLLNPTSTFTATGQASLDIAHGFQGHLDGLVALAQVAKQNIYNNGTTVPIELNHPDTTVKVHKSYMILYITNNSSTPVYGKMAVFKPRKNINDTSQLPSAIATNDLQHKDSVANEWVADQTLQGLVGAAPPYQSYIGATDAVRSTALSDLGWIWHNSPSFQKFWKGKIKDVVWAPMECKKFTFKMKKRFTIDCNSEYSLQPSTTAVGGGQTWHDIDNMYLTAQETGFSYMHRGRGFFTSFLLHGIPARDSTDTSVGLTQPKMDLFWLNAYKYSWTPVNRREFHVNSNPLASITPQIVQLFTPTAGPPING